jgi:hypothetical protein
MCTCITLCWTRLLFNTALIGPVVFGGRVLCVLVLHSAGPDCYLTLTSLIPWHLEDGGRELCALVLQSAGPDSYLTLL